MSNEPPDLISETPEETPAAGIRYRRAIIVSVVVHAVGLAALLFWYLPSESDQPPVAQTAAQANHSDSPTPDPSPTPPLPTLIQNPQVPAEQIKASIDSQLEEFDKLSDERKLSELEKNLKRLDAIATEESVREVTSTIAGTLGLEDTYADKQPPDVEPASESSSEGTFDTKTAQLSDVARKRGVEGRWQYESVLVDANGRTLKIPMSGSEGETAFNTFEQMKKFPMAAGIYRSVVMPMMQKMIEAGDLVDQVASEAQRLNQEQVEPIDSAGENPPEE